ncbi:tubulin polyglutamylase ttll6-like protein [Chrysochromulina tobinii]|uniref:Tubulin--tyrosine ligase-like protein 5 n=1 Tax=Chrysochromulina tobinii TaxID=1460289 RepID=A0A0M0J4J5_9EUKA|nr:tubulin polyglutamylase ttll6-like protein [Chrysochromulina tobinii]|eukprot:KOO21148.1 tubulin polyglutamylase ttll6-like protein [Chrysochromulina sp. CCMP291]
MSSASGTRLAALACLAVNAVLVAHNELLRSELPVGFRPRRFLLDRLRATLGYDVEPHYPTHVAALIARLRALTARQAEGERRIFRVDRSRADYRVTVAEALEALGLRTANDTDSWDFDVYWGNQWTEHAAFLDPRLAPHILVSSVLGLMAETLGDKGFLGHALQLCAAQFGHEACDFIPPIYAMPHQMARWREAFRTHRYWMRKDKKVWGSASVSILSSLKQLPAEGTSYLLQQYVARPLLWQGFKHDLRLWAVLTSVRPLRLYLLQDGWARIAARRYDAEGLETNAEDVCMHLTATYCAEVPTDSLRLMRTNLGTYRNGLATHSPFARELWPAIERAILKTVLFAAPLLEGYEAMLSTEGASYRRFGFLSLDLILTATGAAYVEEVNTNGFLLGTRIPNGWQYTLDAMTTLGLGGYPRRPEYARRLEAAVAELCDLDALGPLAAGATSSPLAALSAELAIRMYDNDEEAARRAALVTEQSENAEDRKPWDRYGLDGPWGQAKAAVREENRALMASIRAARNLPPESEAETNGNEANDDGAGGAGVTSE